MHRERSQAYSHVLRALTMSCRGFDITLTFARKHAVKVTTVAELVRRTMTPYNVYLQSLCELLHASLAC